MQAPQLDVVLVPVHELNPAPYNPRKMTDAESSQLRTSLERFGFVDPLVVNSNADRRNIVIGGHQRLRVAIAMGFDQVPVVYRDLDEAQERELNLRLNRNVGGWDWDALAAFDHTLLLDVGFTSDELDAHFTDDDDQGPEEPPPSADSAEPRTRPGDLFVMGRHRLLCGDSFAPEDRARLMCGASADAVLMDPPFAIYGSASGISSSVADDKMVRPFFEQLGRAAAESVDWFAHVYCCCDWRSYATLWEGFKRAGLTPKNCLVWDKGNFGMGASWTNAHEFVAFFSKLPPEKTMTSGRITGQRQVHERANVLRFPRVRGEEREHNAAKPIAMLQHIMEAATDRGGRVLDLFGGSGSVLMAAEKCDRVALTCEIEPRWCDVIVARWERATGLIAARTG